MFYFKFYGKDVDFEKLMKKQKKTGEDVKTISMQNSKASKQIVPLKVVIDADSEIRATNFHGTTKTGRPYSNPQVAIVRATGKNKSIDIGFPLHQLQQIIDSFVVIRNENSEYFDDS